MYVLCCRYFKALEFIIFYYSLKESGIMNVTLICLFLYWKLVICLVIVFEGVSLAFLALWYISKVHAIIKLFLPSFLLSLALPCLKTLRTLMNFNFTWSHSIVLIIEGNGDIKLFHSFIQQIFMSTFPMSDTVPGAEDKAVGDRQGIFP